MATFVQFATGGIGPYANQIGWVDFTGISITTGTTFNVTNSFLNIATVTLNGVYVLGSAATPGVSVFGGTLGAAYTGVGGNTTLVIQGGVTQGQYNLSNISVIDFNGNPMKFNIITGDCETTTAGENFVWKTNTGVWTNLGLSPATGSPADAFTGFGTNTVTSTPTGGGSTYQSPILMSTTTSFNVSAISNFTQRFPLGILITQPVIQKQVDSTYAKVGTILTYTIPITNYGTNTLTNAKLIDTLPNGVVYNSGTLLVNGVAASGETPSSVTIPLMSPGQTSTVTFKVTVYTTPSPNPIVNNSFFSGLQGTLPVSTISNNVVTTVNYAQLNTIKYVDKSIAIAGDILTYSIVISNVGNTSATSIVLTDTVPSTTSYITGTVTGATGTPPTLTVSNIGPGAVSTVTFKVLIGTNPNNPILNNSSTTYSYVYNPLTSATGASSTNSNVVSTTTNRATISSISKSASEAYGTVLDTITYTLSFTNTGNDTATNITFLDTIPNNTSFNQNTLFINNTPQTGLSPAPPRVSVGDLGAGQTTTITFNVTVTTVPTLNPIKNQGVLSYTFPTNTTPNVVISNIVATTINYLSLRSSKTVSSAYSNIGQVLTYTIPITNTGNTTANNIIFLDTIPNGTSLVSGSLKQDGIAVTGTPNNGVTLPISLKVGGVTTVTFQVIVTTVPVPNPIPNTATVTSSFTIDSTTIPNRVGTTSTNTNTVTTQINFASLAGITKYADKSYSTCGDSINYTIIIPNSGNVTAQDIILKDTIPNGTVLIPTSVYINGIQQSGANPSLGVTIPNIAPGTTTLTFSVQVQC